MPIPFINLLDARKRKMPLLARMGLVSLEWELEVEEAPVIAQAVIEVPDRESEIARLEIRLRELGLDRQDEAVA